MADNNKRAENIGNFSKGNAVLVRPDTPPPPPPQPKTDTPPRSPSRPTSSNSKNAK